MNRLKSILFNGCIALNALVIVVVLFHDAVEVPVWLQVAGRLHPMLLHFPITLVVIVVCWEFFINRIPIGEKYTIGDWLLLSASLLAVLTALMGALLSKESGYDTEAIALHKWMGIGVAVTSITWYAFRSQLRKRILTARVLGVLLFIMLVIAGHEGAVITHGEDFVFEPVQVADKRKVLLEDAFLYADAVRPILEEKCYGCHNDKKAKGGLIMHPVQNLLKGGDNGVLWDTLDSEGGLLMHHLNLPVEDDVHMPPKGKPQLTSNEKQLIYYWIKSGPDFENKVIELSESDTLRILAASFLQTIETDHYSFDPANDELIAGLNTDYRLVEPVALNSPALHVEFFGASFFRSDQLDGLLQVRDQIISLNLNRMPVQDSDLKIIGEFKNLRKLNLSGTAITGASLSDLGNLKELRQLSVTGTSIHPESWGVLASLDKLSTLFVWDTGLTDQDMEDLRKQWPKIQIESGFTGNGVVAQLSPPQLVMGEEVFTTQTSVNLKHFVNGAVIHYTLDGTEPDSLHSPVYDGNQIIITESLQLRARAYLKGWISSDFVVQNFFKAGYQPDSIQLRTLPNPDYDGRGGLTLFDLKKGTSNFKTPHWLGYRERSLNLELFFNEPLPISVVTISCLVDLNSYIFPGAKFEVWSENDSGKIQFLAELAPNQPATLEPAYLTSFQLKFQSITTRKLLIVGKPVSRLPNWHPGKGDKGWIFVDEIFIN